MKEDSKKKILIADPSSELLQTITDSPLAKQYRIETASHGFECMQKILSFRPDLAIIDFMLSEMHGIEILRKMKEDPSLHKIGVILCSYQILIQNYQAALKAGADYFLNKPFSLAHLFDLIESFFSGTLKPEPFSGERSGAHEGEHCYIPKIHPPHHYIKFWGTRGSNPVSGPDYVRFGGNTSCLEVRYGDDVIIFDAGTGLRLLGEKFSLPKSKIISLFFSHTHWDHVTGFPFFQPLYRPDAQVCISAPSGFEKNPQELFTDMLAYSFFPVRLDDIQAKITFQELHEGQTVSVGGISVTSHYAFHPGITLCFKIRAGNKTFGYATDNEFLVGYHGNPKNIGPDSPLLKPHQSLIDFYRDCDFLIHEAQYFPLEYLNKVGWGHSSIPNAALLIKYAGIKEWIVTHHDPQHRDKDLQKKIQLHRDILEDCEIPCHVSMAYDGLIIPL